MVAEDFFFFVPAMAAISAFLPSRPRPSSRGWSVRQRVAIVPGHPAGRIRRQFGCVPLQLDQVLERVGIAQLAGMDQAHEQIADRGPIQRAIEQRVLTVENRPLQGSLHDIVIERSPGLAQKQCQGPPVPQHVSDRFAQPGVWLRLPLRC